MDSYTFTGRQRVPLSKKINPIWWLQNDAEQSLPDWYMPEAATWRRFIWWNVFRNPAQNLRAFVLGVQDRNYTVIGRKPVLTVQRDDLLPPEDGFQWSLILLSIPRPFLSLCWHGSVFYAGWQPTGFFGLKFTKVFAWLFWFFLACAIGKWLSG